MRLLVRLLLVLGALSASVVIAAAPASAHPLGNFTVNRYTGILVQADGVEIDHVVDLAEIPTAQLGEAIDDLPAALGVRGSVWVAWQHVGYATTWLGPVGPLEHGPSAAPLPVALAWARRRARVVLLRPEFSPGTWYSVGVQDDGRHPRLELG